MTDFEKYLALPEPERNRLGFMRWREEQHIGTHGPDCWSWGPAHYTCALREIARCHDMAPAEGAQP